MYSVPWLLSGAAVGSWFLRRGKVGEQVKLKEASRPGKIDWKHKVATFC